MNAKKTGGVAIVATAAVVTLSLVFFRPVSVEAVYPFERMRLCLSRHVFARVAGWFAGGEARAENARLRREVAVLALVRADADRLGEENVRLRRALGFSARQAETWVPAEVLSHGGAAGVRELLRIGKGSLAGVSVGDVVAVPEGVVGRIAAVTPHTSEVRLLADGGVKVACEVGLPGGGVTRGILSGDGDLLTLRHLTGDAEIPARAPVMTSGRGGVFPKGLEIGTVQSVRRDDAGRILEATVLPAVDGRTLEDVFVRREK